MLDFQTVETIFNNLYSDVNGYTVSSQARNKLAFHDKAHTYGEIKPDSFYEIIGKANPQEDDVFYDLGSGTGKAVILAHLLCNFKKCVGIEVLKDLSNTAEGIQKRLESETKPHFQDSLVGDIEFLNADFLRYDFSDADIVFTHSTCFYDELWAGLCRKFETLRPGTRIITVTKAVQSEVVEQLHYGEYQMGWGKATIYIYRRI